MADLARTAHVTAEDLPYLAPEDGLCELVAGEIVREPAPAAMAAKVRDFLAAGARAVWVIDPSRQTVTVHRPGRPPATLSRNDTLDGGSAVPGFRLPVREIFEG